MKEKMVCVKWEDASYNGGYYDKNNPSHGKVVMTKTIGFFIKSDRKAIVVSHDRFYDEKGKLDDERHFSTIPRALIREIVELYERKK